MTLDPSEANPMLVPQAGAFACRIAAAAAEVRELLEGVPGIEATPTFDSPLVLLADDADLAERLRAASVHVPRAAGTYAERQWDARESVEVSAHRIFDHAELGTGVTDLSGLDARYAVATILDAAQARVLIAKLATGLPHGGLIVDARVPRDLRVFVLASLERGRCVLVRADAIAECASADLEAALRDLVQP